MTGTTPGTEAAAAEDRCAQCSKLITGEDCVAAGGKSFCRSCHAALRADLERALEQMSSDIPYPNAALGAVLGGVLGILAWWGFTVASHMSLGLLAIIIGYAVGWFTVKFAGGKRSGGLQALSVSVATLSYLVATYLVNMTFINRALAGQGETFRVAFPPQNLELIVTVLRQGFGVMDLVFLAIAIYEAWKIPRPLSLPAIPDA